VKRIKIHLKYFFEVLNPKMYKKIKDYVLNKNFPKSIKGILFKPYYKKADKLIHPVIKTFALFTAANLAFLTIGLSYNKYVIDLEKNKAAILISSYKQEKIDYLKFAGKYLLYLGPMIAYFNGTNKKVRIFNNATKSDLEEVLNDESYQSIVICGHGAKYFWTDSKGEDVISTLIDIEPEKKKKGEFLQMTCGSNHNFPSLSEVFLENPKNGFYFTKEKVRAIDIALYFWAKSLGLK